MPRYTYDAEVRGYYGGEVIAKNKKEAQEMAQIDMECEGLHPVGEIWIERLPKEASHEL